MTLANIKQATEYEIARCLRKGVILSSSDVEDLMELYIRSMSGIEIHSICAACDEYIDSLIAENKIYRFKDMSSYKPIVSNRGLISRSEYYMMEQLAKGNNVKFVDTEFPITKEGKYIIV